MPGSGGRGQLSPARPARGLHVSDSSVCLAVKKRNELTGPLPQAGGPRDEARAALQCLAGRPSRMGKPNPALNPHVRKAGRFKSEKP